MSDKTETQLPTEGGSTPRACSASSKPMDLEYFGEHGHIKMEDAQSLHCIQMRQIGITDPDEIIANWNRRDPEAPWGSGIVGTIVKQFTEMVRAFMLEKIAEAQSRQNAQGEARADSASLPHDQTL